MAKGKGKYEIHPMKAAEKRRESLGQGKFELDDMVEYSLGGKTLDTQFVLRRMLNRTMVTQMNWGKDGLRKVEATKRAAEEALARGETKMEMAGKPGEKYSKKVTTVLQMAQQVMENPDEVKTFGQWDTIKRTLMKTVKQMGHKDFSVATAAIGIYLEALRIDIPRQTNADSKRRLEALEQELKKLFIAMKRLDDFSFENWVGIGRPTSGKQGLEMVLDEMEELVEKGYDISNDRKMVVDMAQGKVVADATLDMEWRKFNNWKAAVAAPLAKAADEAWIAQTAGKMKEILGRDASKLAYTPGSKSIIEALTEQVIDIATEGKSKKYSSKKKSKTRVKPSGKDTIKKAKRDVQRLNKKLEKAFVGLANADVTAKLKQRKINTRGKTESGTSLAPLMALLNSKLPETVARNMGPPGLENQTGRFASSVRVTDVSRTAQGFPSVGYDYQRNPYQVFEMGRGQPPWATPERDPRNLIDKSIREIAAQLAIGRFYTRRI